MLECGYPVNIVKLMAEVDESLSTDRPIEVDVPQNTVLLPHLFNIFTADLLRTEHTTMCLYTDDTTIAARFLIVKRN